MTMTDKKKLLFEHRFNALQHGDTPFPKSCKGVQQQYKEWENHCHCTMDIKEDVRH